MNILDMFQVTGCKGHLAHNSLVMAAKHQHPGIFVTFLGRVVENLLIFLIQICRSVL